MDDPELEAIRQKRLSEMKGMKGQGYAGGGAMDPAQREREGQAKAEQEERRKMILQQILMPEARERLSRIALVKPENARGVEDLIIRAAQSGQLGEKIDEAKLISLLEQLDQNKKKTTVTIVRRGRNDDDDF